MKKLSYLLVATLLAFNCNNESVTQQEEQVCDNGTFVGDVTLNTQEELNTFGNMCYSKIIGNVLIGYDIFSTANSDIVSLDALNVLVEVNGNLTISNNYDLASLEGLENLMTVTDILRISLRHVTGEFGSLLSLDGLQGLNSVGGLNIGHQNYLQNFDGLNLSTLGKLVVSYNNQLQSIEALQTISTSNLKYLVIEYNESLVSMSGLESVTSIDDGLALYSNYNLESLSGLQNLEYVGHLSFSSNNSLTSLEGLNKLEIIDDAYNQRSFITNNEQLQSLSGLENLVEVDRLYIGSSTGPNGEENMVFQTNLVDFCALGNLVNNANFNELEITLNAYNPTVQDIIDGNCSQ